MIRRAFVLTFLAVPAALSISSAAQEPGDHAGVHQLHGDPKAYIAALDDPARDEYQKPHEVLQALAVREGEVIADVGAGSGYFSIRLAQHVGASGRVYAVDVSADMVRHLHARAGKLRGRDCSRSVAAGSRRTTWRSGTSMAIAALAMSTDTAAVNAIGSSGDAP